jgi:beta-glucosidase
VQEGVIDTRALDEAVRRVLRYKFRRGLFAEKLGNPNAEAEQKHILGAEHRAAVRTIAERSMVLLKNDDFGGKPALPMGTDLGKVAVVGAIADNPVAYLGHWRGRGEINGPGAEGKPTNHDHISTVKDAFEERFGKQRVGYAQGNYVLEQGDALMWTKAHAHALGSDAVVMVIGESAAMSGEGASVTNDALPVQKHDIELAKSLYAAGHKVIVVNISGRPKPGMHELEPYCHALVQGFQPGTEAGNAIVNLLTGSRPDGALVNFSGKLSVELPREAVDMLSVHHERETTGRPGNAPNADGKYTWGPAFYDRDGNQVFGSKLHADHPPAFPFGFGLSYSPVSYSGLSAPAKVSPRELWSNGCTVQVTVRNDGKRAKHEAVQAYMQLLNASENQPEKRLVGSVIVALEPGEEKQVSITIPAEEFEFASERAQGARVLEPGTALIGVGASSDPKSWMTATVEVVASRHFGRPHEIQSRS